MKPMRDTRGSFRPQNQDDGLPASAGECHFLQHAPGKNGACPATLEKVWLEEEREDERRRLQNAVFLLL
jgi:hypothetical protein